MYDVHRNYTAPHLQQATSTQHCYQQCHAHASTQVYQLCNTSFI